MLSEDELAEKYVDLIDTLTEMDNVPEDDRTAESDEVYDRAIAELVLLHEILEFPGDPAWTY